MKHIVAILLTTMMVAFILSACGEKADDPVSADETTVVIETTADGGTIEKDAEENVITKDKDGSVTSVMDKNGNSIDISEYLSTHSWVTQTYAEPNGSSAENKNADEKVEGTIPIEAATVPGADDIDNLPEV